MKYYENKINEKFVGRKDVFKRLDRIYENQDEAKFIVVYGRRRIGKTALIEHYFRDKNIFKFEGIQTNSNDTKSDDEKRIYQIKNSLRELSHYFENDYIKKLNIETWSEFFDELNEAAKKQEIVLYFEEVQWLANYKSDFLAELKPFWDNYWSKNKKLTLVLCGSSVSFFVAHFMSHQALYSRNQEEFLIKELNLLECSEFLKGKGAKEVFLANLCMGGVVGYLKRLQGRGTVYSNLCQNSFIENAYYLEEYEKIFVSRMSHLKYYKEILDFLATQKYASLSQIIENLKGEQSAAGGKLTQIMNDLVDCRFVEKYTSLEKREGSLLVRYRIIDEYLHFYIKFIKPLKRKIESGFYNEDPLKALNKDKLNKNLGFSFERWCLKNHKMIAQYLQISKLDYQVGSYFSRKTDAEFPGFQIDLMFFVDKIKVIVCEIKYYQDELKSNISAEIDQKIALFKKHNRKYAKASYEKVLITCEGLSDTLREKEYFDEIINLETFFDSRYW